jgi:hypothetical protein
MNEIKRIEARRAEILREMGRLRWMRRGSVTAQHVPVKVKGKREPQLRGPYGLYTRKEKGKSVGRRLRGAEVERYREEVLAFHRFQTLCREYAEVSERLAELERGSAEAETEKKPRKSRSSKTRR